MQSNSHNDLDWLAFCYAAGELNSAEAEQFEERLATEQPAREALARAVEMTQAVAAAESQPCLVTPAARVRPNWAARLSWMAIGSLTSLILAMVWSGAFKPATQATANRGDSQQRSELAAAWTEARAEFAIETIAPEADEELLALRGSDEEATLEETPSWMTTAVMGLAGAAEEEAGD
jgi:hypothetical protein